MADKKYQVVDMENGICKTLPVDSKFAKRLIRGSGNPVKYVSDEQKATLRKYIPTVRWGKDERIVYMIMQDVLDRTGVAPTARQIAEISEARYGGEGQGLSETKVQRALKKLQERSVVFEA